MKWIGAHIWDWVTRFRNDVYMEDLPSDTVGNVVGYDTNTKKLSYFTTPTGGAAGDENLNTSITVTNQDEGFAHILDVTYTTGDTYTEVLEAILSPYNRTTIRLDSLETAAFTPGTTTWGDSIPQGASTTFEVGQHFRITELTYSVVKPAQTIDDSVDFKVGTTNIAEFQDGAVDIDTAQDLTSIYTVIDNDVTSVYGDNYAFNVTVVDDGGSGLGDETLQSNYINFIVKIRIRVGGSAISSVTNYTEATALYDEISAAYDSLSARSDVTIDADSDMASVSNYSWIMYPYFWGTLSNVYLLPGTPLGIGGDGAWGDAVTFDVINGYGQFISYNIHRSSIRGAYSADLGQQIKLIF